MQSFGRREINKKQQTKESMDSSNHRIKRVSVGETVIAEPPILFNGTYGVDRFEFIFYSVK